MQVPAKALFVGFLSKLRRFHGWDWFSWLESRTVTAGPQSQLPLIDFS